MQNKTACIGLGANLGDREAALNRALAVLKEFSRNNFLKVSSFYETSPVGGMGPDYLNAACSFETDMSAEQIHEVLMRLEQEAGRIRSGLNAPRTLDLDLLFYGSDIVANPNLCVPHPRLALRAFVLVPLNEIEPDWVHPLLKESVSVLLQKLPAENLCGVKKYDSDSIWQTISKNA